MESVEALSLSIDELCTGVTHVPAPLFRAFSDWYADLNRWVLASFCDDKCDDDLESLATLTSAVAEGLAVRYQAGPHLGQTLLEVWGFRRSRELQAYACHLNPGIDPDRRQAR
jgi:hypothetical protein